MRPHNFNTAKRFIDLHQLSVDFPEHYLATKACCLPCFKRTTFILRCLIVYCKEYHTWIRIHKRQYNVPVCQAEKHFNQRLRSTCRFSRCYFCRRCWSTEKRYDLLLKGCRNLKAKSNSTFSPTRIVSPFFSAYPINFQNFEDFWSSYHFRCAKAESLF